MKRIYSSHNLAAVHHAKNVLETEGIQAVVKNEMLSSAMGELPPAECQAELWVLALHAERATRILRFESWTEGEPWRCPAWLNAERRSRVSARRRNDQFRSISDCTARRGLMTPRALSSSMARSSARCPRMML